MADKKISQLSSATTPLAGTEELAIVQGGSTVKATAQDIADLAGGGLPYLVYSAVLNQFGTANPAATVFQNTIGNIIWQRNGTGQYNTDIQFDGTKTFILITSGQGFITYAIPGGGPQANKVCLANYSSVDGGQSWTNMDNMYSAYIEIRVYP